MEYYYIKNYLYFTCNNTYIKPNYSKEEIDRREKEFDVGYFIFLVQF